MRYARLDDENKVVEVIISDDIAKRYSPEFVSELIVVPENVSLGWYRLSSGAWLEPAPDNDQIIQDGKWVDDPVKKEEKKLDLERKQAISRLQNLNAIQDQQTKAAIEDIVLLCGWKK